MSKVTTHPSRSVRMWSEPRRLANVYGEEFATEVRFAELEDGTVVGSVNPCEPPYYATTRPGWFMGVAGRDIVVFRAGPVVQSV